MCRSQTMSSPNPSPSPSPNPNPVPLVPLVPLNPTTGLSSDYSAIAAKIKSELVDPTYYHDVQHNIHSKSGWKLVGDITETLAKLVIGAATIVVFIGAAYNSQIVSFIGGALNAFSSSLLIFAAYALRESSERTAQVNMILDQVGIKRIPDIIINTTTTTTTPATTEI